MTGGRSITKVLLGIARKGPLFALYASLFFLLTLTFWVSSKFGSPTVEQIIFHIQFREQGVESVAPALLRSFMDNCVYASLVYALLFVVFESRGLKFLKSKTGSKHQRAYRILRGKMPFYLFFLVLSVFVVRYDAFAFFKKEKSDYIAQHYVFPKVSLPDKASTKNLILIYVESLEASYSNRDLFSESLLSDLESLPGFAFENFRQLPGANWTIAGMTASQCAIPLKPLAIGDGNAQGEFFNEFLPDAVCLGDILKGFGYENVFLGGASLKFAGKGKFLQSHGYSKTMGKEEWLATGRYQESRMNSWGIYDDELMLEARTELNRLVRKGSKFNLTLLTVETHSPRGIVSPSCRKSGAQNFEAIVRCTSRNVAGFIRYAIERGYLKNTNIVVLGDHLSMPNPLSSKLDKLEERFVFNRWISSDNVEAFRKNRAEIVHFDVAPTLLEFLGFRVEGDLLGLGYTALNQSEQMPPQGRFEELQKKVLKKSEFYTRLWVPLKKQPTPTN